MEEKGQHPSTRPDPLGLLPNEQRRAEVDDANHAAMQEAEDRASVLTLSSDSSGSVQVATDIDDVVAKIAELEGKCTKIEDALPEAYFLNPGWQSLRSELVELRKEKNSLHDAKQSIRQTVLPSTFGPFNVRNLNSNSNGSIRIESVRSYSDMKEKVRAIVDPDGDEPGFAMFGRISDDAGELKFVRLHAFSQFPQLMGRRNDLPLVLVTYRGEKTPTSTPSGSPPSTPPKENALKFKKKYQFIRRTQNFEGDLPWLYEDSALNRTHRFLNAANVDNKTLVAVAWPGAGKTRTIVEAAKDMSFRRIKLTVTHPMIIAVGEIAKQFALDDYKTTKTYFSKAFNEFLEQEWGAFELSEGEVGVLHFDEIQHLMGTTVVGENMGVRGTVFDHAMPAFGDAVNAFSATHSTARICLSGTNCFAPLVFNGGSSLKIQPIQLDGGFPVAVVGAQLQEYFDLSGVDEPIIMQHIEFVSVNRRAVQHWFAELYDALSSEYVNPLDALSSAVQKAYDAWATPVLRALHNQQHLAITAFAVFQFPEVFSGRIGDSAGRTYLILPEDKLPKDVREYALAGGLHLEVKQSDVWIQQPTGCVRKFLQEQCMKATSSENVHEVEAFQRTAKSSHTDQGHLYERLLATELTLVGSRFHELLSQETKMNLKPDPLAMAREFVYIPAIHEADWGDANNKHRVYCVEEDAKFKGRRLVDVAFPLYVISDTVAPSLLRVYTELKVLDNANTLWKECYKFFMKMKPLLEDNHILAVFLSYHDFVEHTPQNRKTKNEGSVSAHDSRDLVMALLKAQPNRFLILEGKQLKDYTVLPLTQIYELVAKEVNAGVDIEVVNEGMSRMNLYSSPGKGV